MITDMKYETTKVNTKPSKVAIKKAENRDLDKLSTSKLLWHLVVRHKFALVVLWSVYVTIQHFLPTVPVLAMDAVRSIF